MPQCYVRHLGTVPYQAAWDLQKQIAGLLAAGESPPTLLLLEHPHTYTFGRRGNPSNLLWDETELKQRGIEVYWVDRGGDVTYHGPGQLVGYPILPLDTTDLVKTQPASFEVIPRANYIGYLRKLEQVLILTLHHFGVKADRVEHLTGVWVGHSKIAAIGVKVDSHGITRHGFALNVSPDMSYWDGIIGCGLVGSSITSLAQLLTSPPSIHQVIQALIPAFEEVFEVECLTVS